MHARDDAERAAFEHESATSQLHALKQNAAELQAKIAGFREQRDALSQESGALRDSLAGVRARHSTLTQILNDRSYTADAVQKLFAANERGGGQDFHAVGVLADYAEVEEQHESAIEQYLRDELEYVVVETYDHARAGVSMLRDEVGGRATFFVDSLRNLRLSSEYEPIVNFRAEDGVISRLDKLVEFRDPLGPAAKQFLPRLRSAYLTDSTSAAEKLARENSQYAFVTPDGTCYQGRMVTGGRPEVKSAQERAERAKNEHAAAALSRAEADAESARLAESLVQLRGSIQTEQNELAAGRAAFAALNERLMAAEALAARLNEERAELERREAALQQQVTSIGDETSALVKQSEELSLQLEGLRGEKLRLEVRQRELEQEWDTARTRVTQMEDHLRMGRQSLQELREQRGHAEVERAKNDSDRQHLRETCVSEVNAQPEDLIATEAAFMSGEELAIAETNYREMKQRIESMGPVNMMALEEFNECEQRFTFLTRERDDLLQSIADTQQAIAELDLATKEKFEHAFHAINENFSEAFHTIFDGGMAESRLTEADSSGDAGTDIVASPPGKRLQNVLLLSGGEKAMTALALLIAIFRYQPSPFCILDEVDAPLDEANVGRFTRLIGEMSGQTQFIIVTHNRKTMEMGSVLYGVTMQEPGVSRIVSVRWEDEEAPKPKHAASAA